MKEVTDEIKKLAKQLGADLVGVADLKLLHGIETIPETLLQPFTSAVVIAFQLSPETFEQIVDEPTPLYMQQYAAVNQLLDGINLRLQNKLLNSGYKALAIPASQSIDKVNWRGHISTKAVAIAAGIGWQGKSLLLVTPEYGPRVRIACLLTDAPLEPDPVMANRCGGCTRCRDACPAGAIYGTPWNNSLRMRKEAINLAKCEKRLKSVAERQGNEALICGVCIKVCPWSKPRGTR